MHYSHPKTGLKRSLVLLCSALALPTLAAPLTEAESVRRALARAEFSELDRARLHEAEADAVESQLWPNPSLELRRDNGSRTRESAWQFSQALDISGRRGWRQQAAAHRVEAAQADTRAARRQRRAELREAFYRVVLQQQRLDAFEQWAQRLGAIAESVGQRVRTGDAAGYDHRRLLREHQAARTKLVELRAEGERQRARLAALMGQERIDEELVGPLAPDAPADLASLRAQLARRPELAALGLRAEAAQAEQLAAQAILPPLALGLGGKQTDDGVVRTTSTVLALSIPLPLFDRQQAAQQRTAAQALAARASHRLAQQHAQGELLGLYAQANELAAAAERYRRNASADFANLVRIAETAYRAGESTVLELLDAYRSALDAETTALDLEWQARNARIELDRLTEMDIE